VEDNGLQNRKKKLASFVDFCETSCKERANNGPYHYLPHNLKLFAGSQPLPFVKITDVWIKDFEKFLLTKVSHNTTIRCMNILKGVLTEAVRRKIINRNPWLDLSGSQLLKMQDIIRQAFTPQQLQNLSDTFPFQLDPQIKQAYFFSCFTGLRWCDVNQLKWDEIIIRKIESRLHYCLHFEQEKTEGIEYLPLSENAIEIIEERKEEAREEEKCPYLFPRMRESPGKNAKYNKMRLAMKVKFDDPAVVLFLHPQLRNRLCRLELYSLFVIMQKGRNYFLKDQKFSKGAMKTLNALFAKYNQSSLFK
jgi:integrase